MWKISTRLPRRTIAAGLIQRVVGNTNTTNGAAGVSSSWQYLYDDCQKRCYRRTAATEEDTATKATTIAVPPNLMFDFKSSFAPKRPAPATAATTTTAAEVEETDESSSTNNELEYESSVGNLEEFDDDDEDLLFTPVSSSNLRKVIPLPDRLNVPVHHVSSSEEAVGSIWLDATVFGIEPRIDLVAQNVNYIRNKIRGMRKAKSKTISEVSGSGRKVRAQKGGGIARAGHSRPAHWRGGAKAHGPKNTKNYANTKLNKRTRALAIKSVLSQKLLEGNLILVDHLKLDSHKTGPWARWLEQRFGVGKALRGTRLRANTDLEQTTSALILDHYYEESNASGERNDESFHASYRGVPINLWVASSNIPRVTVQNHRFLNVYEAIKNEKLILTLSALQEIEEKWKDH